MRTLFARGQEAAKERGGGVTVSTVREKGGERVEDEYHCAGLGVCHGFQ